MAAAELERLFGAVERQRGEIGALCREAKACREELLVLCKCLADAGVLRQATFLAQLHRRRFAAYKFCSSRRLDNTLQTHDVALPVAVFAGLAAVRALGAVSRLLNGAVASIIPATRALWPRCVYVCGGTAPQRHCLGSSERLSTATGTWEALPQMAETRAGASAVALAGKVYVCGGYNGSLTVGSVESFSPDDGAWEAVPSMLVARQVASGGAIAGGLYICGGFGDRGQVFSSLERYDAAASSWSSLPPMLTRRAAAASGVLDGALYVCGGWDGSWLGSVERFRPAAGGWQAAPPMPTPRGGVAAAVVAGRLYLCGGRVDGLQALSSVERFDPTTETWEAASCMSVGRYRAAAVAVAGCLCIFGGKSSPGSQSSLSSAEHFDPRTGEWRPLEPMTERRSGAAVAALLS